MLSPLAEEVISTALKYKNALLKFITPNNVGQTGSHECGFYLPKSIHGMYTPYGPDKGENYDHHVTIFWPHDLQTDSVVKWYGRKTRSEYRLTSFGRDFPYLAPDMVGNVLVLVAENIEHFRGFVLSTEDDIQNVSEALSVDLTDSWALYNANEPGLDLEDVTDCVRRLIFEFVEMVSQMPTGQEMSENTQRILKTCDKKFLKQEVDRRLLDCVHTEFDLFKMVERKIWLPSIQRQFEVISEFLNVAQSILQSRKSRAGRSLENHTAYVFQQEGLHFESQPKLPGKPDMIFPNETSYYDAPDSTIVLGIKTTCRDRWRQILNEAPEISKKYILTLQPAITLPQLQEMHDANVSLIVPAPLHRNYPAGSPIELMSVSQFVNRVKETVPDQLWMS